MKYKNKTLIVAVICIIYISFIVIGVLTGGLINLKK